MLKPMRNTLLLVLISVSADIGYAQPTEIQKHHISVGLGPAIPSGSSSDYLSAAPMATFRYGYRVSRLIQADAGLHFIWGAAHNQNAVLTDVGQIQGGDHEFVIPLGARLILPIPITRIETSVGAGGAYLHYSETAPSNGYYQTSCYSCSSRGGWGGYGLANVAYFLDGDHLFHVGLTAEFIDGHTNGQAVGNVPALRTTDRWMMFSFEFGLYF
jgi:hypothetical protein